MYSKDRFLTFTDRNMILKIRLELDAVQRRLAAGDLDPAPLRGCLDRAKSYAGFAAQAGRLAAQAGAWCTAIDGLLARLASGGADRSLFAETNLLFHEMSERAAMPVSEHHYAIRTSDRPDAAPATFPCVVVLDNLRSAFNAGAILRSCDGFAVERVVLTGITPGPDGEKARKTAMGSDQYVAWERRARLADALRDLRGAGYRVVALETVEGSESLFDAALPFPLAVVGGNEEFGILEDQLDAADTIVHVPMFGRKNSFNVGITLGIFLYEARRQWEVRHRKA
jgi:tRNA G18 (ribose-2'-O)-methylase SpoU